MTESPHAPLIPTDSAELAARLERSRAKAQVEQAATDQPPDPDLSEPKRLTFLRRSQMTKPDMTDAWLVENLVRPGVITMIAGPQGAGKSWLGIELALLLAHGEGRFLGRYDVLSGPLTVLHLDEENGPAEMWRRDEVQMRRLGLDGEDLPYSRASWSGIDLLDPEWQDALTAAVDAYQADVLILDSISAMYAVEERRETLMPVYRFLRGLLKDHPRLAIILVHHLTKRPSGDRIPRFGERDLQAIRGGGWIDWVSAAAILSPLADDRWHWATHKRLPPDPLILRKSPDGPLEFASEVAVSAEDIQSRDDKVLGAIRAGATTVQAVMDETHQSKATVNRGLASLRDHGLVAKGTPLRETEEPTLTLMEDD